MSSSLAQLSYDLVRSFVKLLELRNPYNIDHCKLVAHYCAEVADEVGLDQIARDRLVRAAEVHTLGVLLQMEEKHPDRELPISGLGTDSGRDVSIYEREKQILDSVLGQIPQLTDCTELLRQRHEWFDGSGSMLGLCGQQIPAEARLLAVVDAFVDLATPKAHRPPEPTSLVLERLREQSGKQFDPDYVEALIRRVERQGGWSASRRARQFEAAHCRHYLGLGHFYTQIHETDWALRSYVAAERLAQRMEDEGLELASISGQFMVFCDLGQLERARETLQQVRARGKSERAKMGYQLLWGLLEWLSGNRLGQEILDRLIEQYRHQAHHPGLTAALGFQACMTLFEDGAESSGHRQYLEAFLDQVAAHDVFDVVERYRPYTIPVLLSAVVADIHSRLAQNLLTRMGEPCHAALHRRLKEVAPARWTSVLMPEPVIPRAAAPTPPDPSQEGLRIETLGRVGFVCGSNRLGVEDWKTLKIIKLFLRLALSRSHSLASETLAEELWPDSGPEKARNSLRNALHQVRKTVRQVLGDKAAAVLSRSRKDQTISLELDYHFDFEDFEKLYEEAQKAFAAGHSQPALELARRALEGYQGDFLPGFEGEWVESLRARLRELRIRSLMLVARSYLAGEQWESAELAARELLTLDDLRDEAHALLLEALACQGRSAEAIEHYEKAVDLFEEEIGVAPTALRRPLEQVGLLL
ncbi:MAG: hypothetical protein KC910_03615 [Candidatus Eremiobacteraeota bacterium]|nr:hypothetical protein [Candidatus Eremiobacteraeota bacterium]